MHILALDKSDDPDLKERRTLHDAVAYGTIELHGEKAGKASARGRSDHLAGLAAFVPRTKDNDIDYYQKTLEIAPPISKKAENISRTWTSWKMDELDEMFGLKPPENHTKSK